MRVQAAGIRFIGFRNEQAAGYAAAACGFLTGVPGVLLTVSGPGAVHGIAGLSHAQINTWPMLMLSGSSEQVGITATAQSSPDLVSESIQEQETVTSRTYHVDRCS